MLCDGDTVPAAGAPESPMSRIIVDLEADDADDATSATSYWQRFHLYERLGTERVGGMMFSMRRGARILTF